jgi:hypothetical protein
MPDLQDIREHVPTNISQRLLTNEPVYYTNAA